MTLRKREDTEKLKEKILDRIVWRTRFGRDYGSVVRHDDYDDDRGGGGDEL
jgi:hypothetical protein